MYFLNTAIIFMILIKLISCTILGQDPFASFCEDSVEVSGFMTRNSLRG